MDDTDRQLLALLRDNARTPVADLARRLAVSRTTVQSRLARLTRSGVVAGFTVAVAEAAEQALVRAHVMVTLKPRQASTIEAALRRIPEVRTLHAVSGPFDLIAVVAAESVAQLDRLLDQIGMLDGVERTTSAIVLATRIQR